MAADAARPALTPAIEGVLAALGTTAPLRGLDVRRVLVVALSAYGDTVASVRPLAGSAARVVVGGERRTIELGLRPRFFVEGDAPSRLTTLAHELLHVDARDSATLDDDRRHAAISQRALDRQARAVAAEAIAQTPATTFACLGHHGEVSVRQWLRRPCELTPRRRYGDADVFFGVVTMETAPRARSGWW